MQRREFIALLVSAAAAPSILRPLAARAQQPALPVIGWLSAGYPGATSQPGLDALRQGLNENGYAEGRDVTLDYRRAEGQFDRLPALAADLVGRRVSVIVTNTPPGVLAARSQTTAIPIVFGIGEDPVSEGLVASLNRPGGNITGVSSFNNQLMAKRLALLHEVAPGAATLGLLVNPNNPNAVPDITEMQAAADALGAQLKVLRAGAAHDLEKAFADIAERQIGALLVGVDLFFRDRSAQIVELAANRAVPAIYERRLFPAAGGLMSYGASEFDVYRQIGVYFARILKGAKPADLPVQQAVKFEFVINLKAAKALSLAIPPGVLAIADEVIE